MTKIQWTAFTFITRALALLLFRLVGEGDLHVVAWQHDLVAFLEAERKEES